MGHGEGNPEAADRFNTAEREFVSSARGKKKIQNGADVRPEEEADLAGSEQLGRERAKKRWSRIRTSLKTVTCFVAAPGIRVLDWHRIRTPGCQLDVLDGVFVIRRRDRRSGPSNSKRRCRHHDRRGRRGTPRPRSAACLGRDAHLGYGGSPRPVHLLSPFLPKIAVDSCWARAPHA